MLENASAIRHGSEGRSRASRHGSESPPPRTRSRATNDVRYLPRVTNPRAQDRRRRDLITTFLSALAPFGMNDLTQVMVRRAAELTVAAEVVRAGMLTGNQNDIAGLIKLENAARRAVLALGLKVEAPKTPRGLQRARERWAQAEEAHRAASEVAAKPANTEPPNGTTAE
jgi:hypothetical protein